MKPSSKELPRFLQSLKFRSMHQKRPTSRDSEAAYQFFLRRIEQASSNSWEPESARCHCWKQPASLMSSSLLCSLATSWSENISDSVRSSANFLGRYTECIMRGFTEALICRSSKSKPSWMGSDTHGSTGSWKVDLISCVHLEAWGIVRTRKE